MMATIISKRGREEPKVDIEIDIMSDEELDEAIRKASQPTQPAELDEDGFYVDDWMGFQKPIVLDGLRFMEKPADMEKTWDAYHDHHRRFLVVRVPERWYGGHGNEEVGHRDMIISDQFLQSLSRPLKDFLLDTI